AVAALQHQPHEFRTEQAGPVTLAGQAALPVGDADSHALLIQTVQIAPGAAGLDRQHGLRPPRLRYLERPYLYHFAEGITPARDQPHGLILALRPVAVGGEKCLTISGGRPAGH